VKNEGKHGAGRVLASNGPSKLAMKTFDLDHLSRE